MKLGEVGLHDPHAGVGKVGDVDVVVGDAAKLVGKKVTARVAAVSDGLVWAELLTPAEELDEPLTAEGEAERPTRAKKTAAPKKKVEADAVEEEPEDEADDGGGAKRRGRGRDRRGDRRRARRGRQEEDTARIAGRPQPQEEDCDGGRRSGCAGRRGVRHRGD